MARMKLKGRGRLPKPENLVGKSTEQLVKLLGRFGMSPDLEALESSIVGEMMRHKGVEFADDALIESIEKAVERRTKAWLLRESRQAIHKFRMERLKEDGANNKTVLRWIAVADSGTCPSCIGRHQEARQLRTWIKRGLPGSPALICASACRCHLIPVPKFRFPGE